MQKYPVVIQRIDAHSGDPIHLAGPELALVGPFPGLSRAEVVRRVDLAEVPVPGHHVEIPDCLVPGAQVRQGVGWGFGSLCCRGGGSAPVAVSQDALENFVGVCAWVVVVCAELAELLGEVCSADLSHC